MPSDHPAAPDLDRALTLGPAAASVRREVGPIAWAVLECLATAAEDRSGVTVSYVSVRGVAGELGLAKDTVARALRRLAAQRLVTHVPARDDDGRFGSSHYRLTIPPDVFVRAVAPRHRKRRARSPAVPLGRRVPPSCRFSKRRPPASEVRPNECP